jgi:hypothetical protein
MGPMDSGADRLREAGVVSRKFVASILQPLPGLIARGMGIRGFRYASPPANSGLGSPARQPPPFPSSSSAPRANMAVDFVSD